MFESTIVYAGLLLAAWGVVRMLRPPRLHRPGTHRAGLPTVAAGIVLTGLGLVLPAPEARAGRPQTHLDAFVPVWQFHERHTIRVGAPPERVFEAIKAVRADEVFLFRALTWIRRGGRSTPRGILNAGESEPLLDVAVSGGFVRLAEEAPRELVLGTAVIAPPGTREALAPETFGKTLPPGFALAAMNFLVTPDGSGAIVTTETRVFANSASARRRFAAYWRLIYPGSALIRRMWLRAVARRATGQSGS